MHQKELEEFDKIEQFLRETCNSLLKDVRHSVLYEYSSPDWPTPIPALLYCFSVVNLLSSFCSGSLSPSSEVIYAYFEEFLHYDATQIELLEYIYKYKLFHPNQSRFLFHKYGMDFYWEWVDNDRSRHLRTQDHLGSGPMVKWFTISILSFAEDIEASVFQKDNYLHELFVNPTLKQNAWKVLQQFIDYTSHS